MDELPMRLKPLDDASSYQPSTEESDSDNSNSLLDHAEIAPSHAESTSSSKSRKRAGLGKQKPASDKSHLPEHLQR